VGLGGRGQHSWGATRQHLKTGTKGQGNGQAAKNVKKNAVDGGKKNLVKANKAKEKKLRSSKGTSDCAGKRGGGQLFYHKKGVESPSEKTTKEGRKIEM